MCCIVNLSNVSVALEIYLYLWNSLITMFLCIYYLYVSWFSSKPLFAIARYSFRYSVLALEKNMPLFAIVRYLKPWIYFIIIKKTLYEYKYVQYVSVFKVTQNWIQSSNLDFAGLSTKICNYNIEQSNIKSDDWYELLCIESCK